MASAEIGKLFLSLRKNTTSSRSTDGISLSPEMPERKHRALCKEPNRNFSGSRTLLPAAHARFWSQLAVVS